MSATTDAAEARETVPATIDERPPGRRSWPFRECVGDPCVRAIDTAVTQPTPRKPAMTIDLLRPLPDYEAEAATEILRMLTSDRADPLLRCRADVGQASANH